MYLLLDIGGTTSRIGTSADGQKIDAVTRIATPASFTEAMAAITKAGRELLNNKPVDIIIAGVPGPMDADKTRILKAPNLADWNNQPLQATLSEAFQASTHLENDAALAGIGEANFGVGREHVIIAYLTISTGIGGARIVNRSLDICSAGFEPGHHIISFDGQPCTCGANGHWEGYASGAGLRMKYGQEAKDITDPAIWEETTRYVAIGINNVIGFWSPTIVIMGGSLVQHISLEKLDMYMRELKPVFPHPPILAIAALGDMSGLWGGLAYAQHQKTIGQ